MSSEESTIVTQSQSQQDQQHEGSYAMDVEEIAAFIPTNVKSKRTPPPKNKITSYFRVVSRDSKKDKYSEEDEDVDSDSDFDIVDTRSSKRGRKTRKVNYREDSEDEDSSMEVTAVLTPTADSTDDDNGYDGGEEKKDDISRTNGSSSSRPRRSSRSTTTTGKLSLSKQRKERLGHAGKTPTKNTAAKRKARKTSSSVPSKKKKIFDSDSEFSAKSASEEEEDSDEYVNEAEEEGEGLLSDEDVDNDDDFEAPPKSRGGRKKSTKSKPVASKKEPKKEKKSSKMAESFKPHNTPIYKLMSLKEIEEKRGFLDPCGMEATDDIIDKLIGKQVDVMGGLLLRSMENGGYGTLSNLLRLGTACSGTDAPALALTLIQEQMEARGLVASSKGAEGGDDDEHDDACMQVDGSESSEAGRLEFKHVFSCENDPFKQAYLARNFDSNLYPDICKLTAVPPIDVYGQEVPLGSYNLFVAGTSCKNFSMLRSNMRIDIEDKGCSGETFLAACEILFKDKPPFAIFENVQNAPWEKMSEYITGRVKLSNCGSEKAISNAKDKKKPLVFALDSNNDIVVDIVPGIYGVRVGSKVAGYIKGTNTTVKPVKWPKKGGGKTTCTLEELMTFNGIKKANDTLVFDTPCVYCTHLIKVDSKEFGLPQTRNRGYLFVWQPEGGNVNDDLGHYWEGIIMYMRSPVRHSLEAFLLNDDHDIIRRFREALNGPPGRKTKTANFLEPDFWTSTNANLPHNKNARKAIGMGDKARPQTKWKAFGEKSVPPHYWLEYVNCNNLRIIDLLDILHVSALRDAESHDSNFTSFYWNLSQNATKDKHRAAYAGIAGCVTPGGDFFVPHKGRPLLGCEKLLIQGLPYFRLVLGNESEVQLGDLAGNAMSVTVVSACMLAAITCRQLKSEKRFDVGVVDPSLKPAQQDDRKKKNRTKFNELVAEYLFKKATLEKHVGPKKEEELSKKSIPDIKSADLALDAFKSLAKIAHKAVYSAIWCTCETSGRNSLTHKFVQCAVCRVSCCRDCLDEKSCYQFDSHESEDVVFEEDHDYGKFQTKLRELLPTAIFFPKESLQRVEKIEEKKIVGHRISLLSDYTYYLHRIKRDRKKWVVIYYAREKDIGEAVAQVSLTIGELKRVDLVSLKKQNEIGLRADFISFLPARVEPVVFGDQEPCLSMTIRCDRSGSLSVGDWEARSEKKPIGLIIEGEDPKDSPRVRAGLLDKACEDLVAETKTKHNKTSYTAACQRNEGRRWTYVKNWKEYPGVLNVKKNAKLGGRYILTGCEHSTNMSSLWVREPIDNEPTMYIVIKPNVHRTGPDRAIITTSICHDDINSILAELPTSWQPSDALLESKHNVRGVGLRNWTPIPKLQCWCPKAEIAVRSPKYDSKEEELMAVKGLTESNVEMLCHRVTSTENEFELPLVGGQKAQQIVRAFNAICSIPIQKHVAKGELAFETDPDASWQKLESPKDGTPQFGLCDLCVPPRPNEIWFHDVERKRWARRYESGQSREFRLALERAPKPFKFIINRKERQLSIKFSSTAAAHQVARQLLDGRGIEAKEIAVSFRFFDSALQTDPVITPFKVKSCDNEDPTNVILKEPYELYVRQQKVVTKMLSVENSDVPFEEIEMIEHSLPGSTGLGMISQAKRAVKLRGGVIADAIGAGKTVISISLILAGLSKARSRRTLPQTTSASLVVMPPGLLRQWKGEFEKFSPQNLKVLIIYDFKYLKKYSVKDIINADVVLVPIDILDSPGYFENLMNIAKLEKMKPYPKLPTHSGQKELNGARGVWIPSTSADPYGGANNSSNQANRNEAAYYTHVYQEAIKKIRGSLKDSISGHTKGVPIEFFEWERIFVDEVHESLCTTKSEIDEAKEKDKKNFFKEKNRRVGRELLGICIKDPRNRPLVCRRAVFGLTGTPLLDSSNRVVELANLMGNTYIIGLTGHWRKLEKESSRDIFLENYLEPKQGREVRRAIFDKSQGYLDVACCRNTIESEMSGIEENKVLRKINMSEDEKALYFQSQKGIPKDKKHLGITAEDFEEGTIAPFIKQNAKLESRGKMLVQICKEILQHDKTKKIVVFTDGSCFAGEAACSFLKADKEIGGCTSLDQDDSNEEKNEKISWYQTADVTEKDRKRPRVLVLHFEHCAGLNLQADCNNVILFSPLYTGIGGSSSDAVADVSTELQAIGRVLRAGQKEKIVNIYRIQVNGPEGEEAFDGQMIRRNTSEDLKRMATNAAE